MMNENQHTILCVDDEENILHSLKRLFRKEGYRLLTASSGQEGLNVLKDNDVHLVICDQRMPEMSGTEFMAKVRVDYPDVIRIILTGYTDVDSITESVNRGHIYKFLLKPWNDHNLKLEIRQGLEQYELVQTNKSLQKRIMDQNEELKVINENLEMMVQNRTQDLEIQNRALELSRAILDDLPFPIIGVGPEGMIVMLNNRAMELTDRTRSMEIGKGIENFFSDGVAEKIGKALEVNGRQNYEGFNMSGDVYDMDIIPLSGRFKGKGIVLVLRDSTVDRHDN